MILNTNQFSDLHFIKQAVRDLMELPLEDEIAAPMMIPTAPPTRDATDASKQDTHGQ